jgi:hypothetical protein
LGLLKSSVVEERKLTAILLGAMSDSAEQIGKALTDAFVDEHHATVQTALIRAMGVLLAAADCFESKLREQYGIWFRNLVEHHPLQSLRAAAAHASIEAAVGSVWQSLLSDKDVSPHVAEVLIEAYWTAPDEYYSKRFVRQEIIEKLTCLQNYEPLLRLLEHPDTTPDEAQTLVRGLLWNALENGRSAEDYWRYEMYNPSKQTNIYNFSFRTIDRFSDRERKIANRILSIDKVWILPTNLFSFFFGLPDSRDELRKLIAES